MNKLCNIPGTTASKHTVKMSPKLNSDDDSHRSETGQSSDSDSDGSVGQPPPPTSTATVTRPSLSTLNTFVKRVQNSANQGATRFIKEMEMQAVTKLDTFKVEVWQMTTR